MSSKIWYALLFVNILVVSAGMLMMRYGGKDLDFSQGVSGILAHGPLWLIGLATSWIAGLFFAVLVTRLEITTAISLYIPLPYIIVQMGGYFLLGEHFSGTKIVGICLILAGMLALLRG